MVNLVEELVKYSHPSAKPRPLEFEFAGETLGCDPSISELTVPHVVIYIPRGFIRKYNLATIGRDSEALPDAYKLWSFLSQNLALKGMAAKDECGGHVPVDEVVKELLEWPYNAYFDSFYKSRKGVLLEVKADYDPYWEDSEQQAK